MEKTNSKEAFMCGKKSGSRGTFIPKEDTDSRDTFLEKKISMTLKKEPRSRNLSQILAFPSDAYLQV